MRRLEIGSARELVRVLRESSGILRLFRCDIHFESRSGRRTGLRDDEPSAICGAQGGRGWDGIMFSAETIAERGSVVKRENNSNVC